MRENSHFGGYGLSARILTTNLRRALERVWEFCLGPEGTSAKAVLRGPGLELELSRLESVMPSLFRRLVVKKP